MNYEFLNREINRKYLFFCGLGINFLLILFFHVSKNEYGNLWDEGYIYYARSLLGNCSFGVPPSADQTPGYPVWLVFFMLFLPEDHLALANIFTLSFSSLILYRFLDEMKINLKVWSGIFVFFIWFLNPFLFFIYRLPLAENLFIPLLMTSLLYYLRFLKKGGFKAIIFCMLWMALSYYARPVSIFLPLFMIVPVLIYRGNIRYYLTACIVFFLILSPWWIRNYNLYGKFVLSNTHSGESMWGSNNEYLLYEKPEWAGQWVNISAIYETYKTKNQKLSKEIEQYKRIKATYGQSMQSESFAKERVMEFWRNNITQLPWLSLQKLKWFWHYAGRHPITRTWYFDLLGVFWYLAWIPFAVMFLFKYPKAEFSAIFYVVAVYFSFLVIATFGSVRLRVPMEFLLMLMYLNGIPMVLKKLRL